MAVGRAFWKGYLKLSLVTCPVAFVPVTSMSEKTHFHHKDEVRVDKNAFKGVTNPKVDNEMVELASHILDKIAGHFDTAKFKDEYELALRRLVQRGEPNASDHAPVWITLTAPKRERSRQ